MSVLISIIIISILIMVHELGHFAIAKYNDVQVDEFSIGMGPKLLGMKKGETEYTLRLLPLGGYVRMAGMDDPENNDPRGFNKKSVSQRMAIIFAGAFMNFVTAIFFFIFVFMVIGVPSNANVIGDVLPDRPAERIGLEPGDQIIRINDVDVGTWEDIVNSIHLYPGEEIELTVSRGTETRTVSVVPELDEASGRGLIGILQSTERQGFFDSIVLGMRQAYDFTKLLIVSLVQMFTGAIAPDVSGPVGIVQMVGEVSRFGAASLLTFAGILSINLAVINLFPIPALDGSRLVFLGLEALRGRPIDPQKENVIHLIGFALLMILMVVITYQDILRLLMTSAN